MAKTLRTLSAVGFITKGAPLLNSELDQNFIDLYTDIIARVQKTGDTLTGKLVFAPSTATFASLNVPSGVTPTTPIDGDFWVTTSLLNYRLGTQTKTVLFSDGDFSGTVTNASFINNTIGSGNTWSGNTIQAVYGGTGFNSYTMGDTLYALNSNTLAKLPIGTNGQIYTVVDGLPSWANSTSNLEIEDTDVATTQFLLFASGIGNQTLKIDSVTTPLSYVPSTGVLTLNGGLTSDSSSVSVYNTTVSTVAAFGAATSITLGTATTTSTTNIATGSITTGTKTVNIGTNTSGGVVNVNIGAAGTTNFGSGLITGTTVLNLFGTSTSVSSFGAATTLNIGGVTGNSTTVISGGASTSGTKTVRLGDGGTTGSTTSIIIGSTVNGSITLNGASVTTGNTSVALFNTTATTINAFGAATALTLGANTGEAVIANSTVSLSNASTFNINGTNPVVATSSTGTLSLFNANITTVNAFAAVTALTLGGTTAASTTNLSTGGITTGTKTVNIGTGGSGTSNTNINIGTNTNSVVTINGTIASSSSSVNLLNTTVTTVNSFGAVTNLSIGGVATASTTTIQGGAISAGTKAINIGTGSAAGSTTLVTLGSTAGTSTVNVQGNFQVNGVPFSGGATITDDTTTNATYYPTLATATSGSFTAARVSSTKLNFNPSSGQLQATSFNALSDATKKTNVVTANGSLINELRGVEFDWVDTGLKSSGVIAQEVEKVLPHLVHTNENGKSVNYDGLVAYLIEEIKSLNFRISSLESK